MGFWTNFWRETGRNTGKWVSNKVFGNSGWATPRRHYINFEHEGIKGAFNLKPGSDDEFMRSVQWELQRLEEMGKREDMIEEVSKIQFTNNPEKIAFDLEKLLVILGKLKLGDNLRHSVIVKIEAGIKRLILLKQHEMAHFYNQQLKRLKRRPIIVVITSLGMFVGWFILMLLLIRLLDNSSSSNSFIDKFLSSFK